MEFEKPSRYNVAMDANAQEHGEEKTVTSDPEVSPDATILLDNLRKDQNNALAGERSHDFQPITSGDCSFGRGHVRPKC